MQTVRNQKIGHSIKGQSGQMGKTKEKNIYCQEKPRAKHPLNRKGNIKLHKKTTNGIQSKRNELLVLGTF